MRGRSYTPSPPRGYGRRGRSPSPRGGRYEGRSRDLPTSLLVRNLRHDCRQEDLRRSFEQFGPIKDIYLPRDYYTGDPRGFGFVQFVDPDDAAEAKYHMDGYLLHGRELTVVFAEENRKKPTEMRARERGGGRSIRFRDRRRSPPRYYSRSPRYSRSPPPRRGRSRSRSGDYYSPPRRHYPRSISPREERYYRGRSYSRSPADNGSRGRSVSPARGKSRSISRSRRRSITPSPRRSISRSPRGNRSPSPRRSISRSPRGSRSPSPRRSISRSPRGNRSPSPRRSRSYTPEPARSGSPQYGSSWSRSYTPEPARSGNPQYDSPSLSLRRSIIPLPRISISPSPRRNSPRGNRSPSPRRSISRSPRGNKSPSPRRSRSNTPEPARSGSPQYEDSD